MREADRMEDKMILFNFASRSRPERFHKTVEKIAELCKSANYVILAKVDSDDPALNEYLDPVRPMVQFAIGKSTSKIDAINRDIPTSGWDILVNVSDDIVFTRLHFDDLIRQHCGQDDFVLFPEPFADGQVVKGKNERIAVMSVFGKDYYQRDGYVYHPSYKSLFCDNEATASARDRGCLKEVEEELFYHEHPAAGYKTNDAQYKHTESFWNEDKANYLKRKSQGFK